jgi:hypothetical protein
MAALNNPGMAAITGIGAAKRADIKIVGGLHRGWKPKLPIISAAEVTGY